MKFTIKSFRSNGDKIEIVNEVPAFYGLAMNGIIVDYFTTLQALQEAVKTIKTFYSNK